MGLGLKTVETVKRALMESESGGGLEGFAAAEGDKEFMEGRGFKDLDGDGNKFVFNFDNLNGVEGEMFDGHEQAPGYYRVKFDFLMTAVTDPVAQTVKYTFKAPKSLKGTPVDDLIDYIEDYAQNKERVKNLRRGNMRLEPDEMLLHMNDNLDIR